MNGIDLRAELKIALDAVRKAAAACTRVQDTLISAETLEKKDKSPVTIGDFAAQALVGRELMRSSAVRAMIGEESADELRKNDDLRSRVVALVSHVNPEMGEAEALEAIDFGGADPATTGGTHWTLDPIDGTKGFLRREQYAIALALIVEGEVTLAVLGCPRLPGRDGSVGGLFYAIRGEGAYSLPLSGDAEPTRIHVDDVGTPAAARFCESVEAGHSDQSWSEALARTLGITAEPVRMDSQAKYAALARGDASIYLRLPTRKGYEERIWDHAAGALVVEEAGGRVTDIDGKPLDFSRGKTLAANRGVIASNGAFHDEIVKAVLANEPA
ncbi:MAG: 3'(2'),5'-bisphosphate nucleotidase [Myxococcales bacterium]|nr:3'(2'),5'-bisphosphate nucleotidase [Myxococcales bacterium]